MRINYVYIRLLHNSWLHLWLRCVSILGDFSFAFSTSPLEIRQLRHWICGVDFYLIHFLVISLEIVLAFSGALHHAMLRTKNYAIFILTSLKPRKPPEKSFSLTLSELWELFKLFLRQTLLTFHLRDECFTLRRSTQNVGKFSVRCDEEPAPSMESVRKLCAKRSRAERKLHEKFSFMKMEIFLPFVSNFLFAFYSSWVSWKWRKKTNWELL
jgi:hypothetical protein